MRGTDQQQGHVFSYISPEQRVRKDHPLRPIRAMVDKVLKELSPEFNKMYSKVGRPSIPPEQLLRALLLQMLYSVRSERMLMEEIDYNILFRWFVGLNLDDAVWDATVFTKNRDRLLEAEVAKDFLALVVEHRPIETAAFTRQVICLTIIRGGCHSRTENKFMCLLTQGKQFGLSATQKIAMWSLRTWLSSQTVLPGAK
jgi:transposase